MTHTDSQSQVVRWPKAHRGCSGRTGKPPRGAAAMTIAWRPVGYMASAAGGRKLGTCGLQAGHHSGIPLRIGEVNGRHVVAIQTPDARLRLYAGTRRQPSAPVTIANDEPYAVRLNGRIPIVAAIISAIGVVAAALVTGVFTIWHR